MRKADVRGEAQSMVLNVNIRGKNLKVSNDVVNTLVEAEEPTIEWIVEKVLADIEDGSTSSPSVPRSRSGQQSADDSGTELDETDGIQSYICDLLSSHPDCGVWYAASRNSFLVTRPEKSFSGLIERRKMSTPRLTNSSRKLSTIADNEQ